LFTFSFQTFPRCPFLTSIIMEASIVLGAYLSTAAALAGTGSALAINTMNQESAEPPADNRTNEDPKATSPYTRNMKWARAGLSGHLYASGPGK
jgi:hypothetical protein